MFMNIKVNAISIFVLMSNGRLWQISEHQNEIVFVL